jgi:phosphoribosylaminoimidazolecarboxamide formyltransferase/IMP cyclohydrolase
MGVELLSTGGTAKVLREEGLEVTDISEFTGFPEMLNGRVKTLHPKVHAGLLYMRGNTEHEAEMQKNNLVAIDLVCVNLYPFETTIAKKGVSFDEAIEQIDIGGPTMIRSAAKNMRHVTVVTDPADYVRVLQNMHENDGATSDAMRLELGQKVFALTAKYNAAIATYLADQLDSPAHRPFVKAYSDSIELRYGENAHQRAWLCKDNHSQEACIAQTSVLHGKTMSYNNYVDGEGALEAAKELSGAPGVALIKHTNPCGYATGETLADALKAAWAGDPVSAFGSVIAVTENVDIATAEFLKGRFVEALIAPGFDDNALEFLKNKSKDIRLLKLNEPMGPAKKQLMVKHINGGMLVQNVDIGTIDKWDVVTKAEFPEDKRKLAEFGIKACKHTKSNAIVIVEEYKPGQFAMLGMGAGQPNRVDSLRKLAATKAIENLKLRFENISDQEIERRLGECVLVSGAFFPFADNIAAANAVGVKFIVEPGGSRRDDEVIAACDKHGIAMAFTGMRHFKH